MFRLILLLFFSVTTLANPPTFTVGTESIIDIRTTGTALNLGDDSMSGMKDIGFDFTFYNQTFDQVNISMNGFFTFQNNFSVSTSRNYLSETLPATSFNYSVFPLWTDLINRNGTQNPYIQTFGNTNDTDQYFVVGWYDAKEYSNQLQNTFEAILYEGTNEIEFRYDKIQIKTHDITIGVQGNNEAVTYLRYEDNNSSTYIETDDFSITTAEVLDESFNGLSSSCLENSNISVLCDIYDLNTNDLTEDFFDFTEIYIGYDNDFVNTGIDENEIYYGISFTLENEDNYFLNNTENSDANVSIIIDIIDQTLDEENNDLDIYYNDDNNNTFTVDILPILQSNDIELNYINIEEENEFNLDYINIEEENELPTIINIITYNEETNFAELEIIGEIIENELSKEIAEKEKDKPKNKKENKEKIKKENTKKSKVKESRSRHNRNLEIVNNTNRQGIRMVNNSNSLTINSNSSENNSNSLIITSNSSENNFNSSTSNQEIQQNIENNNQIISSNVSFESVGVSNQIAAEQNQTNTVLQSINIIPMDMGGGIANTQIAAVEITTINLETQIESISTEVMSISEAQSLQENVIQSNLADIQEQNQEVQEETGEYSVDLQNSFIGIIGFVPNWSTYMTQLPDNQNWYQDNYLVENITLLDNNEALTSLIGYSSQQHSAMSSQSNNDFFRSYR